MIDEWKIGPSLKWLKPCSLVQYVRMTEDQGDHLWDFYYTNQNWVIDTESYKLIPFSPWFIFYLNFLFAGS